MSNLNRLKDLDYNSSDAGSDVDDKIHYSLAFDTLGFDSLELDIAWEDIAWEDILTLEPEWGDRNWVDSNWDPVKGDTNWENFFNYNDTV